MELSTNSNLSNVLGALNTSLLIQTQRLNLVAEKSIITSSNTTTDVTNISESVGMSGSQGIIESQMREQSTTLMNILNVNESMLDFFKENRTEDERTRRQESVSDEDDSEKSGSENNKKMFEGLRKAIGNLSLPSKGGIFDKLKMAGLAALVMSFADDFVEGFARTVFGEEAAQKVRDFADKYLNTEAIAATALGVFLGGVKGGFLAFTFTALRKLAVEAIEGLGLDDVLGESGTQAVAVTLAGIATAMLTKTGRTVMRAIANAAIKLPTVIPGVPPTRPPTQTPTPANTDQRSRAPRRRGRLGTIARLATGVAAAVGIGATASSASDVAPESTPARQNPVNEGPGRAPVSAAQRQQVSQMSEADLEKQGVRRETRQVGRRGSSVRYRDTSTGRFVSQADVATRSGAANVNEAARRFPRFGMLSRILAPLGFAVALADIASILMNEEMDVKQKQIALTKSIGSILGGAGGAAAGAAIGTLVMPGPGTLIGGALLGIGGSLLGEEIASQVAPWLFGEKVDDSKVVKMVDDQMNQPSTASSTTSATSTQYNGPVRAPIQPSIAASTETKMNMLEQGAIEYAMGSGSSVTPINTNINNGGNVTNNNVGGASNITYNIISRPDRALAGNVPISPTAGSFG